MPLIDRDGRELPDIWRFLGTDEPLPLEGAVAVPLSRWQADRDSLLARGAPLGVVLRSGDSLAEVAADLGRLRLVALEFPKFTDGRPYSAARLLRQRYGYAGELRAVGAVLRDQLQLMKRCNFDTFQVRGDQSAEILAQALAGISVTYQSGEDGRGRTADLRKAERTGYQSSAICVGFWAY